MSKTLIGIVSYGGLPFLRLLLDEIQRTVKTPVDTAVVIAKPGDTEMATSLDPLKLDMRLATKWHDRNYGFPASINDLYDEAFVRGDYDNLIICGNDIVPMPGAIDAMIRTADTTDFEMVCGSEFNSRFLYDNYPEARHHFEGPNLIVKPSAFESRVWELHKEFREGIEPDTRKDIRNMTLFKRSSFEKSGYADVNFWPNGYAEDNDACRRMDLLGVRACGLKEAAFFHWWSRTIHQGESRPHGAYFDRNMQFYREKWGGNPGQETYDKPFHGDTYRLSDSIILAPEMKISGRYQEKQIIEHWSKL